MLRCIEFRNDEGRSFASKIMFKSKQVGWVVLLSKGGGRGGGEKLGGGGGDVRRGGWGLQSVITEMTMFSRKPSSFTTCRHKYVSLSETSAMVSGSICCR